MEGVIRVRKFKLLIAKLLLVISQHVYDFAWEMEITNTEYISIGGTDD
jgi:hypothetical protein